MKLQNCLLLVLVFIAHLMNAQGLEFKTYTSLNKWHIIGTPFRKICNAGCYDVKDLQSLETSMSKIFDMGFGVNYVKNVKNVKKSQLNIGFNYEFNGVGVSALGFKSDGAIHRLIKLEYANLSLGYGKKLKIKNRDFFLSTGAEFYSRLKKNQTVINSTKIFIPPSNSNIDDARWEGFSMADRYRYIWGLFIELKMPVKFFEKVNSFASLRVNNTFSAMMEYQWFYLGEKIAYRQDNRLGVQLAYGINLFKPKK